MKYACVGKQRAIKRVALNSYNQFAVAAGIKKEWRKKSFSTPSKRFVRLKALTFSS
jgi:hypothetical protein